MTRVKTSIKPPMMTSMLQTLAVRHGWCFSAGPMVSNEEGTFHTL